MKRKRRETKLQEQAIRLMEALSGVDEELLERCEESGGREKAPIPLRRYARGWAAVLCLAVVGVAGWGGFRLAQGTGKDMNSGAAAYEYDALQPVEMESTAEAGAPLEEAENEKEEAFPQEGEGNSAGSGDSARGNEDGGNERDASPGESPSGDGQSKEKDGSSDGSFSAEGGAAEEKSDEREITNNPISDEACPAVNTRSLTEEEARKDKTLGGYVPITLPRGYVFESAAVNLDSEEENLWLCWTRGMDSIMLSFTRTENPPDTVDTGKPETYDQRMYTIPYAESVPEEYRQSVNDPVFAREDFSLEMIESRMISYSDSGDTDTPRGNFRVLGSDGVLVRFSGRGTAQEIWEMFCSMEDF